jgi:hypothetical protein
MTAAWSRNVRGSICPDPMEVRSGSNEKSCGFVCQAVELELACHGKFIIRVTRDLCSISWKTSFTCKANGIVLDMVT